MIRVETSFPDLTALGYVSNASPLTMTATEPAKALARGPEASRILAFSIRTRFGFLCPRLAPKRGALNASLEHVVNHVAIGLKSRLAIAANRSPIRV